MDLMQRTDRRRRAAPHGHRHRAPSTLLPVLLPVLLAGCSTPRARVPAGEASVRIVCPAGSDPVACYGPASLRCGREGYDLFDARGRRATVADAAYGTLEARCRAPRQPGQ